MKSRNYILTLVLGGMTFYVSAQEMKINGKIIAKNSQPINNAEIIVRSSKQVYYSDSDGTFKINCNKKDHLRINAPGFDSQTLKIKMSKQQNDVIFYLTPSEKDKLLTTGYDNFSQKQSSHPIGNITNEKEKGIHYNSILEMIQSKVTGVKVGGDNTISIRGGFETPLFVVDGVVVDYELFIQTEPNTVKSINLLKDAAATARYGSRGMNGVIVVSLKK